MLTPDRNLVLLIRVGNLILASIYVFSLLVATLEGWLFSIRNIVMGSIELLWLFAALGLFLRWRIAWIGCLAATGATACFWASRLVEAIRWSVFSSAWWHQHIFGFMINGGFYLIFFSASFGLFVGLVRMRKELS